MFSIFYSHGSDVVGVLLYSVMVWMNTVLQCTVVFLYKGSLRKTIHPENKLSPTQLDLAFKVVAAFLRSPAFRVTAVQLCCT